MKNADAQNSPNTITLDNQSGEFAVVKLVGPTKVKVAVPNGQKITVNVKAGGYYLLGRYGSSPEGYKYTKGDPFKVIQSGREYSVITITLHKVIDGNYKVESVSEKEFEELGFPEALSKEVEYTRLSPVGRTEELPSLSEADHQLKEYDQIREVEKRQKATETFQEKFSRQFNALEKDYDKNLDRKGENFKTKIDESYRKAQEYEKMKQQTPNIWDTEIVK